MKRDTRTRAYLKTSKNKKLKSKEYIGVENIIFSSRDGLRK